MRRGNSIFKNGVSKLPTLTRSRPLSCSHDCIWRASRRADTPDPLGYYFTDSPSDPGGRSKRFSGGLLLEERGSTCHPDPITPIHANGERAGTSATRDEARKCRGGVVSSGPSAAPLINNAAPCDEVPFLSAACGHIFPHKCLQRTPEWLRTSPGPRRSSSRATLEPGPTRLWVQLCLHLQ